MASKRHCSRNFGYPFYFGCVCSSNGELYLRVSKQFGYSGPQEPATNLVDDDENKYRDSGAIENEVSITWWSKGGHDGNRESSCSKSFSLLSTICLPSLVRSEEDKVVISIWLFRVICLPSRLSDHPVGYCPGGIRRQRRVLATMALAQIRMASWRLPSTGMGSRAWKALLFGPRQDPPSAEGGPRRTSKVTHAAHHIMTSFNSKNRSTQTLELNHLAETAEQEAVLYVLGYSVLECHDCCPYALLCSEIGNGAESSLCRFV